MTLERYINHFHVHCQRQLLSASTIPYAKSICVDSCPSVNLCSITSFPCTNNMAFVCPYYAFAEDGITGRLSGIALDNTNYYANLTSMTSLNNSQITTAIKVSYKSNEGVGSGRGWDLEEGGSWKWPRNIL